MPLTIDVSWFPRAAGAEGPVTLPGDEARILDLLAFLEVRPDTVLVVRDGTPVPLDTPLRDGDGIRIVHTVSGGIDLPPEEQQP